ncbi:MAG TPA: hypothetical protein PLP42_16525 [Acidobacteriota bacterium]|nr:hypothetical protein [Acidobacteriota bacterium]
MKRSLWAIVLLLAIFLGLNFQAVGSAKYTKETGKNCKFCHTAVPKKGAEDPLLNEDGKKFQENGNQLTEEQKAKGKG